MTKKSKDPQTKEKWYKNQHKPYLWMNDDDDIQAMVFQNEDDKNIYCIWIKTFYDGDYVSNYFVYARDQIDMHPLDYVITMVEKFKEEHADGEDVPT